MGLKFGDEYVSEGNADCTLMFDMASLPETEKVSKKADEKEKETI